MPPPLPELPLLVLDAASPGLVVGLRSGADHAIDWRHSDEEAGIGLSRSIDDLLRSRRLTIADVRTIVFCDGPGSLLGIRLAAMMLRTWLALPRPRSLRVLAYHSLALLAADRLACGEPPPFHVCSDARRGTWNLLSVASGGAWSDIKRCPGDAMPREGIPLFHPEGFPHWQALPEDTRPAPYRPERVLDLVTAYPLLHETTAPNAFMIEQPTYRTWNPTPASE